MTASEALGPGPREITIDGVRQRYHVAGTGPVCVIHSGGPGIAWEYLRMPALEAKLTTVYVEPIGTGQSGRLPVHPHGYTFDRYARFLHGLIAHLDVPKVYLLGHSHGGLVAQRYALTYPGRLAGMILYSSAPSGGPNYSPRRPATSRPSRAGTKGGPKPLISSRHGPRLAASPTTPVSRR
jgi:proline iminopeptidase